MAKSWTCPQGHEWQTDSDEVLSEESVAARCPVCQRHPPTMALKPGVQPGIHKPRSGPPASAAEPSVTLRLPGFEVLGELGRGGAAVVYKARQLSLDRLVAVKMILGGSWAGPNQMLRFKEEGAALGRLQHPNIVQIFEVGESEGHSYFAMEYVSGGTLAALLAERPIAGRRAAEMVRTLALAIHVAHQTGIVHRDLKPSNVLITPGGVLKISDFGLAKRTESGSHLTDSAAVLGTPSYMAPEQAQHKPDQVGPPADVYALGSILYEMLTGRPPFLADTPVGTVLQTLHDEPVPPSHLQSSVPLDLDTICLKCLEKSPRRRYRSAEALAEDLKCFLDGKPIQARPITVRERCLKWTRRHPAWAVAIAVSCAAAIAFMTELLISNVRLQRQRDHARAMETLASDNQARAEEREAEARKQVDLARRSLYSLQLSRVAGAWESNNILGRDLLVDTRHCPFDLRDLTWDVFYGRCLRQRARMQGQGDSVNALTISPDSKVLAIALGAPEKPGIIKLWDLISDQEIKTLPGHKDAITSMAFAPDGQVLASAGRDGSVLLWNCATGQPLRTLRHAAAVNALAFAPDGHTLATAGDDRLVKIWSAATGEQQTVLKGHAGPVWSAAFSADGRTFASGSADTTVKLWEVAGWKERATLQGHMGGVTSLAFAPEGATLAAGEAGPRQAAGEVRLWNAETGRLRATLEGHSAGTLALTFTPDAKTLITGGSDGTVKFLDAVTGQERATFKEHSQRVSALAMAPNGKTLATGSADQMVALWDVPRNHELVATLHGHAGAVTCVAFAPDGTSLATASADQAVKLWSMSSGQEETALEAHTHWVWAVAYAPDGSLLASSDAAGVVKVWETATRKERMTLKGHTDAVRTLAFAPNGKTLATGSQDRTVRTWDLTSGEVIAVHRTAGGVGALAWTPNGSTLAAGITLYGQPSEVKAWEVASSRATLSWRGFSGKITSLSFSPDASVLAVSSEDWTLKLWDVPQERERLTLHGCGLPAFAPDGNTLAVASANKAVKLLDISGRELTTFSGHKDVISSLAFSPDGKLLATASWDQTVRLWEIKNR